MSAEEFVRRLKMSTGQHDVHYAFWLGAGCSISAGIPGAASLVAERWLPQLQQVKGVSDEDFENWVKDAFPGYDSQDPAAHYGTVMEELFIQPEARQREVEALCDGRYPGFGYAVLAALLARRDGLFNVGLTTNFDDLIADAMYVFTEARPLVIPDEALASFIRPTRLRPLVIKVHGDHRLSPRNTETETETLKQGISESIANLLHDRGVIFVGYGGNDKGIAELLTALPAQALPLGIWWVSRKEPHGVLRKWLSGRNAIWIESPGFEELMLLFQSEFEIDHPTPGKFDRLFAGYLDTYRELKKRVGRIPDSDPQASSLKNAAERADASATDWSAILLQASRIEEQDPDQAEELYRRGIQEFPRAVALQTALGALLMWRGRPGSGLEVADKAAQIDPENAQVIRLRGYALADNRRFDESAEELGRLAQLLPESALTQADYGLALVMNGQTQMAEAQLKATLDRQPSTAAEMEMTALLLDELEEHVRAQEFHRKVLKERANGVNPHANYARCLIGLGLSREAREEAKKALDLAPSEMWPTLTEILFYILVTGTKKEREHALRRLKGLLTSGARSPSWNLKSVVRFGQAENVEHAKWLEPLAEVINGEKGLEVLEGWPAWRELKS